jgi:arginase family enzyme
MFNLNDFLDPINIPLLSNDEVYREGQIGKTISIYEDLFPDLDEIDIIIMGCNETRGNGNSKCNENGIDPIRKELYSLYLWHKNIRVADIGNIRIGAELSDTYAALKTVSAELLKHGKKIIILGGSHDLTLAQYDAYRSQSKIIEVTGVDAYIDLSMDNPVKSSNFLMEILTGEPNYIRHYNHIGFQSYYVHPRMLETMDKLRFDCYRLGKVKENIEEMEPVMRTSDMLSFDLSALGATTFMEGSSPNGFNGEEACSLMRFAGMSEKMQSVGIYGYDQTRDPFNTLAKQVSQMLWYYVDGIYFGRLEADLNDKQMFNECHIAFGSIDTTFIQSLKTGRWWMRMPDDQYIPCSQTDFNQAGNNEIPERWLRIQERN